MLNLEAFLPLLVVPYTLVSTKLALPLPMTVDFEPCSLAFPLALPLPPLLGAG